MAILKQGENEVEVRIKRDSDGACFEEYVKLGERDKLNGQECKRYIVGQPGETYSIEITLKQGYDFGTAKKVKALLYMPGSNRKVGAVGAMAYKKPLQEDMIMVIKSSSVIAGDRLFKNAKFAFKQLTIGELSCFVSELGYTDDFLIADGVEDGSGQPMIDIGDLGSFRVEVLRITGWVRPDKRRTLNQRETESAQIDFLASKTRSEATMVGGIALQKQGIAYNVGFTGGKWVRQTHTRVFKHEKTELLNFNFLARSQGVFEPLGIVPYPPALHCYAWDLLNEKERQSALKSLQDLAKARAHEEVEFRTGRLVPRSSGGYSEDDPKEWRPWTKMYDWEKKRAFDSLQKANKDYERAKVQNQIMAAPAEQLLALEDDKREEVKPMFDPADNNLDATVTNEPSLTSNSETSQEEPFKAPVAEPPPISRTEASSSSQASIEETSSAVPAAESLALDPLKVKLEIKEEPIEDASRPTKRRRVEITIDDDDDDEDLGQLRSEQKRIVEEIEEAERLADLKRKRNALEAKIKAAEARKRKK
ncbi:uncharacterized protein LY89DRAFT_731317 [Mollisia scopiformis]|uniref:DUF7918 domain-containing protein n=1 Tax=Mollisia scopiformis TaxID=149040 RepID=A0A194XIY9_MOLSC|nr:uncharacterized protein LY89DRAFT_731317 [Mollisia scopiformis]KUJ20084.1 hypothetical protein LY89DRAFT_731317 [Mollisia scopiformis]